MLLDSPPHRAFRDEEGSSQMGTDSIKDGFTTGPEWVNWIVLPPDANQMANCWNELEELDTGDERVSS